MSLSKIITGERAESIRAVNWCVLAPAPDACVGVAMPVLPQLGDDGPSAAAAEARLQELERLMERRVEEARAAGFREGETSATRKAAAQVDAAAERLARAVQEVFAERGRFRTEAEGDLVQLAVAIARRILHREIAIDPESLLGLVRVALEKVNQREIRRIRVHPAMAPLLGKHLESQGARSIQIQPDEALEQSAVILETAHGGVDASVEGQLQEVQRGLIDLVGRKS